MGGKACRPGGREGLELCPPRPKSGLLEQVAAMREQVQTKQQHERAAQRRVPALGTAVDDVAQGCGFVLGRRFRRGGGHAHLRDGRARRGAGALAGLRGFASAAPWLAEDKTACRAVASRASACAGESVAVS